MEAAPSTAGEMLALLQTSSRFARLLYFASRRYEHPHLSALLGRERAEELLQDAHERAFVTWCEAPPEEREAELETVRAWLSGGGVLPVPLHRLVPAGAGREQAGRFLETVRGRWSQEVTAPSGGLTGEARWSGCRLFPGTRDRVPGATA